MMRLAVLLLASSLAITPAWCAAKCDSCARDSHGRIQRSATAKHTFERSHPCPSTGKTSGACSGYVIDHVKPLKRGGSDAPSNMQWQTREAAKQKDKTE